MLKYLLASKLWDFSFVIVLQVWNIIDHHFQFLILSEINCACLMLVFKCEYQPGFLPYFSLNSYYSCLIYLCPISVWKCSLMSPFQLFHVHYSVLMPWISAASNILMWYVFQGDDIITGQFPSPIMCSCADIFLYQIRPFFSCRSSLYVKSVLVGSHVG